jgi:hypothetical protein
MTFDDARRAFPGFGLAVYAYDATGPVTLEVLTGDSQYTFTGPTLKAALASAFPELAAPAAEPAPETPPNDVFG